MHHLCTFYVLLWPELHILAISTQIIYNANGTESQQLLDEWTVIILWAHMGSRNQVGKNPN